MVRFELRVKNTPKSVSNSVPRHLQSEQLLRVYSGLKLKEGQRKRGEAGSQDTSIPFSQSVEAPVWLWAPERRGTSAEALGGGDGKTDQGG